MGGCSPESSYPHGCKAPIAGWRTPADGYSTLAIANKVTVTSNGGLKWNGRSINEQQLAQYSSIIPTLNPTPFTILEVEKGASCSAVMATRRTINRNAKCLASNGSACGEGADPWARIGDVIGPNGEMYKYYPDGRSEVVQPRDRQRTALRGVQDQVDAAVQNAQR